MLTAQASAALQSGTADCRFKRVLQQLAGAQSHHDAEEAADQRQGGRLDQELPENLPPGGAERLPQPDLLGPIALPRPS